MAADAQYQSFSPACDHQHLPWGLSVLDIRQFPDVGYCEVPILPSTVFALIGLHPFQEFGPECILKGQHMVIYCVSVPLVPIDTFQIEEFDCSYLSVFSRDSHRVIASTVEHSRHFLHATLVCVGQSFEKTLHPQKPQFSQGFGEVVGQCVILRDATHLRRVMQGNFCITHMSQTRVMGCFHSRPITILALGSKAL